MPIKPLRSEDFHILSSRLLKKAIAKGAAGADVMFISKKSSLLSLKDGSPEKNSSGYGQGLGFRTVDPEGRQGMAYVNVIDEMNLDDLVEWSWNNCRVSEPDPYVMLYEGNPSFKKDLGLFDNEVVHITPDSRLERCQEMTAIARETDPRVVSVRSASWADGQVQLCYANNRGFLGSFSTTYVSCGVAVILRSGDTHEMGGFGDEGRSLSGFDHALIAKEAVQRTLLTMGGKPFSTGRYDLVFDPEATASLLDVLGDLFLASNISKNKSLLKGKLGTRIGNPCITLIDDGVLSGAMGTSPFDAEGSPTGTTRLMEKGVVRSFLYNLKYASRDGVTSTGNASRSISSLPDIDVTNIYIQPGKENPHELLSSVRKGIFISEFLGLHTINPVSGDFSLGIKGCMIDNGAIGNPVAGMTIAGNILDVLDRIEAVAKDLRFFGNTGGCTVVVKDVTAAGS
ncbi:MAG TPA: TldD/PmbA family protein [Synergistales bacterium]|nr:TldD/PmbA family protein [Synergistales bacterium]